MHVTWSILHSQVLQQGLTVPVLTASDVALLVKSEEDPGAICQVKILVSWIFFVSIFSIGILSLIYK